MSLLTDFSGGGSGGYAISEWGEYDNTKYMEVDQTSIIKPTPIGEWTYKTSVCPVDSAYGVSSVAISDDDYLVLITGVMYRYKPSTDTYTEDTNYNSINALRCSMVKYNDGTNDFIYIFGGYDIDFKVIDNYCKFDIANDEYIDMGTAGFGKLVNFAIDTSSDGNLLYIHGGLGSHHNFSSSLWTYDFVNDSFQVSGGSEAPYIFPKRSTHSIGVYDDSLFILGGFDANWDGVDTVLEVDINSGEVLNTKTSGGILSSDNSPPYNYICGYYNDFTNFKIISFSTKGEVYEYDVLEDTHYKKSPLYVDDTLNPIYYNSPNVSGINGNYFIFPSKATETTASFDNTIVKVNPETKVLISKV